MTTLAVVIFANWCLQNLQSDDLSLNPIIYSNECVFYVDGKVSKHNVEIWGTEHPYESSEIDRDSEKIVWCAMPVSRVIGPYRFDDAIVNAERFINLLNNLFLPVFRRLPLDTIL